MGFGHRVYKNYDPRARIIKKHVDEVLEATGDNPLLDIATELEKRALDDEYFTSRKLYPNVDFYSGLIYEALRIPTDMFTVIFAIPRTVGLGRAVAGDDRRPGAEDRPSAPDLHRTPRPGLRPDRGARGAREDHRPAGAAAEAPPPRRVALAEALAAVRRYTLTIRHGSEVERERFDSADEALRRARAPRRGDPRGGRARRAVDDSQPTRRESRCTPGSSCRARDGCGALRPGST